MMEFLKSQPFCILCVQLMISVVGPWRWFDDSMLDCCEPLAKIKANGITFGKVACLAHCNGAKVEAFRTSERTIDDFRKYIITCTSSEDCHVITSYHRGVFKQVLFMLISRPHREPGLLYTLSCKNESWVGIAKYLMHDVSLLLKSVDATDIQNVLSVIFTSLPPNFGEFIKWVAEVRRREDGISPEEKARVAIKEEVFKQVQETGLFKHVAAFLSSANSCCQNLPPLSHQDDFPDIAARVCCLGAEMLAGRSGSSDEYCCQETCIKCLKSNGDKPVTVFSGTVINGKSEQGVDVLVPSSRTKPGCCCCVSSNYSGIHPASNDVLTALLLALPPETWSGIKNEKLLQEISSLVLTENLPTLLQEEVLHLRRQLYLLKRCQENKVDVDLDAPVS
ncbi:hypothetical protein FH972_002454 [Carpinus fangiana]|uniref:glutathione gamma-glutamylcysteinyltransferase n=1 Tax=Carpinus fangiana TaxID=176857 RepID=A0A5N6QFF5_9ROSI|nr:hypothetical protein FH972_002454 [Carpinus fangiana]